MYIFSILKLLLSNYTLNISRNKSKSFKMFMNINILIFNFFILTGFLSLDLYISLLSVLFIVAVTTIVFYMKEAKYFISNLEGLCWIIFISYIGLTSIYDWLIVQGLEINSSELNNLQVWMLYTGISMQFFAVLNPKKEAPFLSYIYNNLLKLWDILKENPLLFPTFIFIFLFLCVFLQFICNSIGLSINNDSWFLYFVCIYTRMVFFKLIISVISLPYTKGIKEWYTIIGINPLMTLAIIPFSCISYFLLLPIFMEFNMQIPRNLSVLLANSKQYWNEYKLVFVPIMNGMLSYLKNLESFLTKSMGELLISMPNRPGQVGKFLVSLSNWALGIQIESISKKPLLSTNHTHVKHINYYSIGTAYGISSWNSRIRCADFITRKPEVLPMIQIVPIYSVKCYNEIINVKGSLKNFINYISKNSDKIVNEIETLENQEIQFYFKQENYILGLKANNKNIAIEIRDSDSKPLNIYPKNFENSNIIYCAKSNDLLRQSCAYKNQPVDWTNPNQSVNRLMLYTLNNISYDHSNTRQEDSIFNTLQENGNLTTEQSNLENILDQKRIHEKIDIPITTEIVPKHIIYLKGSSNNFVNYLSKNYSKIINAIEDLGNTNTPILFSEEKIIAELKSLCNNINSIFINCNDISLYMKQDIEGDFYKKDYIKANDFLNRNYNYKNQLLDLTNPNKDSENLMIFMQSTINFKKPGLENAEYLDICFISKEDLIGDQDLAIESIKSKVYTLLDLKLAYKNKPIKQLNFESDGVREEFCKRLQHIGLSSEYTSNIGNMRVSTLIKALETYFADAQNHARDMDCINPNDFLNYPFINLVNIRPKIEYWLESKRLTPLSPISLLIFDSGEVRREFFVRIKESKLVECDDIFSVPIVTLMKIIKPYTVLPIDPYDINIYDFEGTEGLKLPNIVHKLEQAVRFKTVGLDSKVKDLVFEPEILRDNFYYKLELLHVANFYDVPNLTIARLMTDLEFLIFQSKLYN